jgi:hypothetical protein
MTILFSLFFSWKPYNLTLLWRKLHVKFHSYKNFGGNGPPNLKGRLGIIIRVDVPWANIFPVSSVTRATVPA